MLIDENGKLLLNAVGYPLLSISFFQGPEEEEESFPTLESVRQMREICRVFKALILEVQGDARRCGELSLSRCWCAGG